MSSEEMTTAMAIEAAREMIRQNSSHLEELLRYGCQSQQVIADLLLSLVGWDRADLVVELILIDAEDVDHD